MTVYHFTKMSEEHFRCPLCEETLENVVWDPSSAYWIRVPEGDVCLVHGCSLVAVLPSPNPFEANPTIVMHSHDMS